MILSWMLYSVAFTALVAIAGLCLEGAARALGAPTRRIWSGVLLLGAAAPGVGWWLRGGVDLEEGLWALREHETMAFTAATVADALPLLDQPLLLAWGFVSLLLTLAICRSIVRLQRSRRSWIPDEVEGLTVWISDDIGPGVVGVVRPQIVLPRWAAEGPAEVRRMILDHEAEHAEARDPILLSASLWIPALMPWNLALWWAAHRLRIALEVDCDARVLATAGKDRKAYGSLLLSVGRRHLQGGVSMAAFSRPRSVLEHRIRRLCEGRVDRPWARAGALAGVSALAFSAIAWVPAPPVSNQLGGLTDACVFQKAPAGQLPIVVEGLSSGTGSLLPPESAVSQL